VGYSRAKLAASRGGFHLSKCNSYTRLPPLSPQPKSGPSPALAQLLDAKTVIVLLHNVRGATGVAAPGGNAVIHPTYLYHCTLKELLPRIRREGLKPHVPGKVWGVSDPSATNGQRVVWLTADPTTTVVAIHAVARKSCCSI
jgi:hypothetical protein